MVNNTNEKEKCPKCLTDMKDGQWGYHLWRGCPSCGYQYRVAIIGEDANEVQGK
jgi:tRNA(Ile2) C34 agmatinyltransferase TiaS